MADDLADVPEQMVFFSSRITRPTRRRARWKAMLVPMTPPPMTTTSALSMSLPPRAPGAPPGGVSRVHPFSHAARGAVRGTGAAPWPPRRLTAGAPGGYRGRPEEARPVSPPLRVGIAGLGRIFD